MSTPLPDKWVRKAIYDIVHQIEVSDKVIPCFDTNAANYTGDHYVIMSTQTNVEDPNKCGNGWRSTILLEIFTRHRKNTGSRVLAEDIIDEMLVELEEFNLMSESGLRIQDRTISTPNDITQNTQTSVVHRKFLRYELSINKI